MIWVIKGLYATVKSSEVQRVKRYFDEKGVESQIFKYMRLLPWHTYHLNTVGSIVTTLKHKINSGDTLVAHSYGCAIVYLLLRALQEQGSSIKLKNIFLFNPALDKDLIIPEHNFKNGYIFYEPKDHILRLAQFLPFNIMGAMGKYGYRYESNKIQNIKLKRSKYNKNRWFFRDSYHDDVFEPDLLPYYCDLIINKEKM